MIKLVMADQTEIILDASGWHCQTMPLIADKLAVLYPIQDAAPVHLANCAIKAADRWGWLLDATTAAPGVPALE